MKNPKAISALMAAAALVATFTPAKGADQTPAQAISILTSGPWRFSGKNVEGSMVFNANGSVDVGGQAGAAKWRIDAFHVTIIFADHEEQLSLPIDINGTQGKDGKGVDMVATLAYAAPHEAASAPPPIVPAAQPAAASAQDATAKLLTTGKWQFVGAGWANIRVFSPDGTMVVERPKKTATWAISGDKIVMTFPDHVDTLTLPLDPKGTNGTDSHGRADTATQIVDAPAAAVSTPAPAVAPIAVAPAPPPFGASSLAPATLLPAPRPAAAPSPAPVASSSADQTKILEAYIWALKSQNVNEELQFLPNGSVSVIWNVDYKLRSQQATWRMDHFGVTISFPDREEKISLPLDPTGCTGKDGKGADMVVVRKRNVMQ
ncbi:MAG TPA: hypothetical protein VG733_08790 [Chthoniobacteraceae bacterium]|nr:hypothetical protein [Chthoniobacteraceae bacterium]